MILRLAVLIQYRSVTDTQTHRHTTTAYTALSIASRGKYCIDHNQTLPSDRDPQVFTVGCPNMPQNKSKMADGRHLEQVALLWQRDRATRLSVEILQLQNIPVVWHYLHDPTFSRFYTIPECDRHTHTQRRTDRYTTTACTALA